MNKLYEKFFYVPKHGEGKVREKVMLTRIATSFVLILICLAAMSLTAYAYFSHSTSVQIEPIRSATWEIDVTADDDVVQNNGFYAMDNREGETLREFTFTLSKKETESSATVGYVKIDVMTDFDDYNEPQTFYSEHIGEFILNDQMTTDLERVIKITVPAGKIAYVAFTGEWGTCAKEPVAEEIASINPNFAAVLDETEKDVDALVQGTNNEQSSSDDTAQTSSGESALKGTEETE